MSFTNFTFSRTCINSLQGMSPVKRRRKGSEDTPPAINPLLQTNEPRQCYGPRCVNHARWGSKYCSDECGTNLATNRIYQVIKFASYKAQMNPRDSGDHNDRNWIRKLLSF